MPVPAATDLLLPAQLLPYEQTTLYARVDGYVGKWLVDRGARVKAGDLLAEIDAPELDQQVLRAEATLEQGRAALVQLRADLDQAQADVAAAKAQVTLAEANRAYAASEAVRTDHLVKTGAASRSEAEGNGRNRDVASAQVTAARADVDAKEKLAISRSAAIGTQEASIRSLEAEAGRLKELQKFKRIVAPFNGTITRRYAEVGMLLSTVTPQPLFHVQNSSTLRVQVDVPQAHATAARLAKTGNVIVPESPDRPLPATVARTANALDPVTRTLRVELELPNPDRAVLAGTYAQVRLAAPNKSGVLVPTAALRYSTRGVEVVSVIDGKAVVQVVKLGRDYGRAVEVAAGLTGAEELVANPSDDLKSGDSLRVSNRRPGDQQSVGLAATWPSATAK
jgi:multidrug efflux pump subunit AcrA (membrane-fusion protein)